MHLLLALDKGFESLAAVAIASYLSHHRFESVVLVTPADQRLDRLEAVAAVFDVPLDWQPIPDDAAIHRLPRDLQPYFYCIEALRQREPGRYLYVDADTFCVAGLESLEVLPLDDQTPLAACSHGRPMPDRSLVLGLDSPFHYFNAGVMLFDSATLAELVTPAAVVEYVALTPVAAAGPAAGNGSGIVKWARLEYDRNASAVGDVRGCFTRRIIGHDAPKGKP